VKDIWVHVTWWSYLSECIEKFIERRIIVESAMSEQQQNRPHRKTKEKKNKSEHGGVNPKAFAFAKPGKLQRQAARSHDVKEKRLHVPLVDRIPEDPPPLIVAVVGPPGVSRC
jgi:hypothetical protein